jgi:hypothetical protein
MRQKDESFSGVMLRHVEGFVCQTTNRRGQIRLAAKDGYGIPAHSPLFERFLGSPGARAPVSTALILGLNACQMHYDLETLP